MGLEEFSNQLKNAGDFLNRPAVDYESLEKSVEEVVQSNYQEKQRQEKRETRRFWMNFSVAGLALIVATLSLKIQCKQQKEESTPKPIKILSQPTGLSDSTKKDNPKNLDTISLKKTYK